MTRGTRRGHQVRALERRVVEVVVVGGREQDAARRVAPGPDQRGQAGDGARGHAAAGVPLHAVVEADRRRLRRAVVARELNDLLDRQAAGLRRPLGGILLDLFLQFFVAQGVPGNIVRIDQALGDQHVHHAERERAVGAGQRRDVLRALLRGQAAVGIDGDDLGAAPLGFLRARPEVQVRGDRVGAPDQDQPGILVVLRVHAVAAAEGRLDARLARGRTQGALQLRGAQLVEEAPVHRAVLQHAHGAGIAERQDGLRILGGERLQARGDLIQRLVPADAPEFAAALRPGALERMQQAVGRIGALGVVADLGAQRSVGERVRGVALHFHRDAVLHRHQHRAGVGAIVRAGRADDGFDAGFHAKFYADPSSSNSIQWRTGVVVPPCRCARQPILAVAIAAGAPAASAASFLSRSWPESSGCRIE